MGDFRDRYSDAPGMRVLSSLNNESQSLARRAWTAFWRLVYTALILYKGIKQNAPERPQDALKRKLHFQEHSGRENPLAEHTPQVVYLTFWGVFACAIEWLFMYDHRKPLECVWEGLKENRLQVHFLASGISLYYFAV